MTDACMRIALPGGFEVEAHDWVVLKSPPNIFFE